MHIVMFSINPLFPDYVMGGAPKHLQNIALHMGEVGHDVTILCTRADASVQSFKWHENVSVKPILRFKQPFPQPYAIPAFDMAAALQDVAEHLAHADRFYMHDGEFLFPYAYQHVPTVVSLRDNVYPETLLGGFLFQADKLILISDYSRQYFTHTVGRFFPELPERIDVIHNGLDWEKFKPTPPNQILDIIPVDPTAQPILLHPHRPEESKGIRQTIRLVDQLVHQYGFSDLIALAPRWHDVQASAELREFYTSIEQDIIARGLQKNFIFHDWIPQELMPEYYSLGSVTVSLGNFVESFGNAVYESMGCGTPSIAARISTHRELLPDELIDKVDYDDIDAAAECAARIIKDKERTSPATLAYLKRLYSTARQLRAYEQVIVNAQVRQPMTYQPQAFNDDTRFKLAPWCYRAKTRGIYHDFQAGYADLPRLQALIAAMPEGFNLADAEKHAMTHEQVMAYYRDGYLVPLR